MGLLTDFFVAPLNGVKREAILSGPANSYPTSQWKNVDLVKIATLESRATPRAYEDSIAALEASKVGDGGSEGPWCYRLSQNLTDGLVAMDDGAVRTCVSKWILTEEWESDGVTKDDQGDFEEMVKEFCLLASKAKKEGLCMYVWL